MNNMKKTDLGLILILIMINISVVYSLQLNETKSTDKVYLRLDFNENEIVNENEFNIEVRAFNLENKNYDLKVYVYEDDKNKPISQTKDKNFEWISSSRYVKDFFTWPGNQSDNIKLRINENYNNFSGRATLVARIRESGANKYIEKQEDIFILKNKFLKREANPILEDLQQNNEINEVDSKKSIISGEIIRIGTLNKETESIKTQNNIVYQSKNELIKRYSIYGFITLIIIFLILLAFGLI